MSAIQARVVESEVTVYCLCGDHATGLVTAGARREWQAQWLAAHPSGVDGHGPATEEQAAAARERRELTAVVDACMHAWQQRIDGGWCCLAGCHLVIDQDLAAEDLPVKGVDWSRMVIITLGGLSRTARSG